jgi:hypothetical protein
MSTPKISLVQLWVETTRYEQPRYDPGRVDEAQPHTARFSHVAGEVSARRVEVVQATSKTLSSSDDRHEDLPKVTLRATPEEASV